MNEHSTSQKLIADCQATIDLMMRMQEFIQKNFDQFDRFGNGSSASSKTITNMIFLHEAPADAKAVCRTLGGEWKRVANSSGGWNYEQQDTFHIIIYDAEKTPDEPLIL